MAAARTLRTPLAAALVAAITAAAVAACHSGDTRFGVGHGEVPGSAGARALQSRAGADAGTAARRGPAQRPIEVRLNGMLLGQGLVASAGLDTLAWFRVTDLQRAVDGSAAPHGRLRRSGGALYARDVGGCADCAVHVVRAVVISNRIRTMGREGFVPLEDVARAFEARLSHDTARTIYSLHADECGWCILAPRAAGVRRLSATCPSTARHCES
jgi:hypothetical protein